MPNISDLFHFLLFADDTTCLTSSDSINDLPSKVNPEIQKLSIWFSTNKLTINVEKTFYVIFMTRQKEQHLRLNMSNLEPLILNDSPIKRVDYVKFLGFFLDKNLDFKTHLNSTCTKISKAIYMLSQAAKILSIKELKLVYSALILPYLNYGLLVWGGKCKVNTPYSILDRGSTKDNMSPLASIHSLQKRAFRIISKCKSYISHHIPICSSLGLLDLEDIYNVRALSFFYDFFHGDLPPFFVNFVSLHYSRNNELFLKTKFRRTNIASSILCHTLPYIWNVLPVNMKSNITKSKHIFIRDIKIFYLEKYKSWECTARTCYICSNIPTNTSQL